MNTQQMAQVVRNKLAEAGIVVPASDYFYIGDDTILGKIPADVKYHVDQHDAELGLIQLVFLVLEEAAYEDL
jgi:hypothetical protein